MSQPATAKQVVALQAELAADLVGRADRFGVSDLGSPTGRRIEEVWFESREALLRERFGTDAATIVAAAAIDAARILRSAL